MDSQKQATTMGKEPRKEIRTPQTAAVTLTEFADYECSHCARAYPIMKQLQQEFGSQLKFEFKNYPLDMHRHALIAAEAAEAAREQGMFNEMHDALFQNQSSLNTQTIRQLAKDIGLEMDVFEKTWMGHRELSKVQQDVEEGDRLGVQGTPWFFINDRPFEEAWTFESLSSAIQSELRLYTK